MITTLIIIAIVAIILRLIKGKVPVILEKNKYKQ
jgi:hypothetical protein